MIKNAKLLEQLQDEFLVKETLSLEKKLEQLDSLLEEYRALNPNFDRDIMDGIETDIEIARIINTCSKN